MAQLPVRTPPARTDLVRHIARRITVSAQMRARRVALLALSVSALGLHGTAWAQCTPASPTDGSTVTCTGTASSYTASATNITVNVNSGSTVTAPLAITGAGGTLTNAGTITGSGAYASVQYGDSATITNTGTITSTGSASGAAAISVGNNATVTEGAATGATAGGTLTAVAGTPAVEFGTNGTYIQTANTAALTTGNIVFGSNTGTNSATFTNNDTTHGLAGNVLATGNVTINNNGYWTGSFLQSTTGTGTTATFTNGTTGTFSGLLFTQDQTTVVNNATGVYPSTATNYGGQAYGMTILGSASNPSSIGLPGTVSSFTNNGNLTIGSVSSPTVFTIYGSFTQTAANGVLNIAIAPQGTQTNTAGLTYSQIYAKGSGGTATLAGTLNLNIAPGFYATGSVYQVVLADHGITASNLTITGNSLPFVRFQSCGVVNTNATSVCGGQTLAATQTTSATQQAYDFISIHTSDYAQSLISANAGATANQLAVARGLNPLIALASATPSGNEAGFLGNVDVLTNSAALQLLNSASPQGYYAYAEGLRDQANAFSRAINLRLQDQNSNHDEDGWWTSAQAQTQLTSATGYNSKSKLIGFTGGYDYSGPHHVYGIAANISWDALHYAPGTMSGHNRDIAVAAYSGWYVGPLHLTGQLAYNFGHLGANKTLQFTTYTTTGTGSSATSTPTTTGILNHASASEGLLKATGTAGLNIKAGSLLFEPFVGVDFMRGGVHAFTETSAFSSAAALTVSPISADRTDLLGGVSLARARGEFRPYLRVAYRDRLSGANSHVTAAFDGLSGAADSFTVVANPTAKGEIDTNAGANWVFDDAGSLFLGYQNVIRNGQHAHGVNLGIRIEF